MYVLPLAGIISLFMLTMGRRKLSDAGGRFVKLLSGSMMAALGLVLVLPRMRWSDPCRRCCRSRRRWAAACWCDSGTGTGRVPCRGNEGSSAPAVAVLVSWFGSGRYRPGVRAEPRCGRTPDRRPPSPLARDPAPT
jgi:hypothetical protein